MVFEILPASELFARAQYFLRQNESRFFYPPIWVKPNEKSHINTLVQGLIWLFFHLIARLGNLGVVHFLGANTPVRLVRLVLGVVHFLGSSTPLIITQQCQDKLWAARFRGFSHPPRCCYLRSIHCKMVGSFSLLSSANSTTFDTISTVFGSSSTKGR